MVVVRTEILSQEEVAVLLVVSGVNLKRRCLCATLRGNTLCRRLLLRHDGIQLQLAKLHSGVNTEEARSTLHQRVVGREAHVASLHQLDDFVFLSIELQLQVLRVVGEGGVGVVVQIHVQLVAYFTVDVQVNLLVEVEAGGLSVTDRQAGVVDVLQRAAQFQFGRTLRFHTHTARTEYLLGRS